MIQMGYGVGTANYKADPDSPLDEGLIATMTMAIKAGYYHLDAAQGPHFPYSISILSKANAEQFMVMKQSSAMRLKPQASQGKNSTSQPRSRGQKSRTRQRRLRIR